VSDSTTASPPLRKKRKRGRPSHDRGPSERVNIRVDAAAFDAYSVKSNYTGVSIRRLIRQVVEMHAPVIFRGPKPPAMS